MAEHGLANVATAQFGTAGTLAHRLSKRFDELKEKRSNWEQQWQEVLKFTMPHMAYVTRRRDNLGERVDTDLFDSTARRANQTLAAGFHGFLTNPSKRWFKLRIQEEELNRIDEVKLWLGDTEQRMFDALNGSNFSQQIHQTYLDLGSVGTGTLFEVEDDDDIIRFHSLPIEEIIISENSKSRVDTVFRGYRLTVRQAWEKFGADSTKNIKDKFEKGKFEEYIDFLHVVMPREFFDATSDISTQMPIASFHIEFESKVMVSEGGFREMPYMVTRFNKVTADPYGYSPGLIMLPDIKMLNAVSKTIIKGAQKIVDPPLILPHDGFVLPLKTIPGGINYKTSGPSGEKIEPIATGANLPVGFELQNNIREQINGGYFVDLFLVLRDQKNMTATEVAERVAEKMVMLGPTLGRMQFELLKPIIDRTFGIMLRKGMLLTPPEILEGRDLIVEYISPLALAQKRVEVTGIAEWLAIVSNIAGAIPEVIDKVNGDRAVDISADVLGISPSLVKDDETVAKIREQRAQAQQQAQIAQTVAAGAEVAKTAAEAQKAAAEAEAAVA